MTTAWDPKVLPPYAEPIGTYCQRLATIKQGNRIATLKNWRVTHARAFKSKATSQHEYVSACVVDSTNTTMHIVFERMRGSTDSSNTDLEPVPWVPPSNSSISSLSTLSDIISAGYNANDRILPVGSLGMKMVDDQLIYNLNFPPHNPLYLYQLAITALIVHQVNTSYFLKTNNCYHYAGAIMKLLEIQYNIVNSASGANARKWCGLNIYQDQDPERNLASLVEHVRNHRDSTVETESLLLKLKLKRCNLSCPTASCGLIFCQILRFFQKSWHFQGICLAHQTHIIVRMVPYSVFVLVSLPFPYPAVSLPYLR